MPLTAITLENFKGIAEPVTIPIRSITLLFGKNNDGSPRKHGDVDLLQPGPHKAIWKEYQRDSPIFPLVEDDLIIEGIA